MARTLRESITEAEATLRDIARKSLLEDGEVNEAMALLVRKHPQTGKLLETENGPGLLVHRLTRVG